MDRQLNNRNLPDQDHVLRYCSSSRVEDDGTIAESAFKMRPNEDYLSVNWMEYFCGVASDDDRVDKIRKAVGKKLTLSEGGRFVKLNVGAIKARINGAMVKHIPEPEDDSHSGIYPGQDQDNELTLELAGIIMQEDIFPAI